jgi:hypothetical protein
MNIRSCSTCALGFLLSAVAGLATVAGTPQMPFTFAENKGQAPAGARFVGDGPQFKGWFYDYGFVLQQGNATASVRFSGARPNPEIAAGEPTGAKANYFRGNEPGQWRSDLQLFGSIEYRGLWSGIVVRFEGGNSRVKAEYVLAPGASIDDIRLKFDGQPEIQRDGSLTVRGKSGEFREDKPFLFQETESGRTPVSGGFRKLNDGSIGFSATGYDRKRPLTIDPTILFSGYFGGYSQSTITGVAVNSAYQIIVSGWTIGTDLPTSGGARPNNAGGVDAFVAGFSPVGGTLIFCTYLGGSGDDRAFGVAVDSLNNTYVTGWTSSANFPVINPFQSRLKGTRDAFVTKLNAAGSAIVYSTYLGGSGVDIGNAITLDATNSAVIAGDSSSTDMPVTAGALQSKYGGNQDAFVAKLSASGSSLVFLTYLGGIAPEHSTSVKLDATGAVYLAGSTYSTNFPTLNAAQPKSGGGQDGFVTKMSANATSLIFSTYFGGSGGSPGAPEQVNAIAIGPGGVYAAGITSSGDFPITARVVQNTYGGGQTDGFIALFNETLGTLIHSSFFGGSSDDSVNAMVVDFYGYVYITGYTSSSDFPSQSPTQNANAGGMDAFVAKCSFSRLLYSTYLGGSGNDSGNAIAIDSLTNIVVAGSTGSGNFPTLGNTGTGNSGASVSSFVTKLKPNFNLGAVLTPNFYLDFWHDTGYNATLNTSVFGIAGDIPVTGDWNGSGVKNIGVFRDGTWILDTNGDGMIDAGDQTVIFGQAGDYPVVGDWNGTGRIKLGLFRQGVFILDLSGHLAGAPTGLSDLTFSFGLPGDIPVAADWSMSGTTKVGVFRSGSWLIDYSGTQTINRQYLYGQAGDLPVVGDWASTGTNNIGVYRSGIWILDYSGTNSAAGAELYFAFGGSGDLPLSH